MPITKSAKKALRNSARKYERNKAKKAVLKRSMKKLSKLAATDSAAAKKFYPEVQKLLDKATKTGLMKKNAAARKKSRIVASIKKASNVK